MNMAELVETVMSESHLSLTEAATLAQEVSGLNTVRAELRAAMEWLARDMTRAAAKLGSSTETTVNSLGEVQETGRGVDRLCVLLSERRRSLEVMCRLLDVDTKLVGL